MANTDDYSKMGTYTIIYIKLVSESVSCLPSWSSWLRLSLYNSRLLLSLAVFDLVSVV